jgi:hypothetical protein
MIKRQQNDGVTELLTKLHTIQEDIGAKPKTSDEERRTKAENVAVMGKGKHAQKKGSRFLHLKSSIVSRLKNVYQFMKEAKELEGAGYGGDNANKVIQVQTKIREQIRQAQEEWRELEGIYKKETQKKKSKFTSEELEVQSELVRELHSELEKAKAAQTKGYAKNRTPDATVALNTKVLDFNSK